MMDDNPLRIRFDKTVQLIRVYDGTRYLHYLEVKNMNSFTARLLSYRTKKRYYIMLCYIIMQESKLIHLILYL